MPILTDLADYMRKRSQRPKRRILEAIQIDKIAAVDRPCQEGATVTLMKRAPDDEDLDDDADLDYGAIEKTSRGIRAVLDGLDNAVRRGRKQQQQEPDDLEPDADADDIVAKLGGGPYAPIYPRPDVEGSDMQHTPMDGAPQTSTHATEGNHVRVNRRANLHAFDRVVNGIARSGMPRFHAMGVARRKYPELYQDYQQSNALGGSGTGLAKRADAVRIAKSAGREWDWLVDEIAQRNCISKCAAATRLRTERPDLWQALQASVPDGDDAA